jgi:hypothetical protein
VAAAESTAEAVAIPPKAKTFPEPAALPAVVPAARVPAGEAVAPRARMPTATRAATAAPTRPILLMAEGSVRSTGTVVVLSSMVSPLLPGRRWHCGGPLTQTLDAGSEGILRAQRGPVGFGAAPLPRRSRRETKDDPGEAPGQLGKSTSSTFDRPSQAR